MFAVTFSFKYKDEWSLKRFITYHHMAGISYLNTSFLRRNLTSQVGDLRKKNRKKFIILNPG